jgi:peroxiredoxin
MTDPKRLRPGDLFPALTIAIPGGRSLRLPGALAGLFSVILFYRGSWCPYCNAQLRAFQRSLDRLTRLGVVVAALSVDDEATTKDLIARHSLQFPVGHSADARAVAAATGALTAKAQQHWPEASLRHQRPSPAFSSEPRDEPDELPACSQLRLSVLLRPGPAGGTMAC